MKFRLFSVSRGSILAILSSGMLFTPLSHLPVRASTSDVLLSTVQNHTRQYEGIIIDAQTEEPLIGANVIVKGTTTGVITDMNGRFTIEGFSGQTLEISFIGYQNKEIKLGNVTLLKIELSEDSQSIEEVVVTAFGVGQKKESIVGAVTQVKGKDLHIPSANLSNSFAGRMSGVTAFQRNGEPGNDGADFYIRGISTFTATRPLIIIDGVEASQGDLNALDAEVIESFSVLKDATATAMYGTRGANGVMIVKTKSGENVEKAIINARVEGYVSMPTQIPKFADAGTYMRMYNEAVNNYGTGSKLYSPEFMNGVLRQLDPYQYPDIDWYNELFKGATLNERVNFNIRGGSRRVDYFINANVNHETGMLKSRSREFYSYDNNIDIKRYTFQSNLNAHLSPTATVSMNLGVELRNTHGPSVEVKDLFSNVMNTNPVDFPIMYPTDSPIGNWDAAPSEYIKWGVYNGGNIEQAYNPLAEMTKGYKDGFASTVRANVKYSQKLDFLTKGLQFNALISFKNWSSTTIKRDRGYNKYELTEAQDGKYLINCLGGTESAHVLGTKRESNGDRSYYFQASLNYDRTFGNKHHISSMFLYNQDQYDAASHTEDLISTLPKRKMGIAGRFTYDFAHRYMIDINMGYNGSENFAKGHRWGFFPSVALGWNLSEEEWFAGWKNVIHNLKFRGSYGLVGNADSGTRFMYLPVVKLNDKEFETGDGENSVSAKGPTFSRFQNSRISWEVGYKSNVGIDLGLFNCLNMSFEYFQELRKDIFRENKSIPNYMGTENAKVYGNYGEIKNWGIEVAADYGKQITKDLSIQFKGTFSFARNKVLKDASSWNPDYPNKSNIGYPLNSLMGYVYAGHLFIDEGEITNSPTQVISGNVAPGDIKYVDIPNRHGIADGIINAYDMVHMGYPEVPEIIYGFGPSIKYKNWDFSFFFQGVAHTSFFITGFHPFGSSVNRNVLQFIADDYWSQDNQNIHASYPRLTKMDHGNNTIESDYWLRNGSFLKLKNAEIGFSWKFLRTYVSASNLLTFSPFKHWDPEMGGGNGLKYPTQRVINFGIQLNFK